MGVLTARQKIAAQKFGQLTHRRLRPRRKKWTCPFCGTKLPAGEHCMECRLDEETTYTEPRVRGPLPYYFSQVEEDPFLEAEECPNKTPTL